MITKLGIAVLVGAALGGTTAATNQGDSMVYELRTYTTEDGKLPDLHARFRDHTMRLFEKHGMTNIAYWKPTDKENVMVYLVAHKDKQASEKTWKGFIDDPDWKKLHAASLESGPIVIKVENQFLKSTDYSPAK